MATWMAAIMAGLAVAGQAANLYLNLKLRATVAESETRVLDKVATTYKRQDVCRVEMVAMERN